MCESLCRQAGPFDVCPMGRCPSRRLHASPHPPYASLAAHFCPVVARVRKVPANAPAPAPTAALRPARFKVLLAGHTQCAAKIVPWLGREQAQRFFLQARQQAGEPCASA